MNIDFVVHHFYISHLCGTPQPALQHKIWPFSISIKQLIFNLILPITPPCLFNLNLKYTYKKGLHELSSLMMQKSTQKGFEKRQEDTQQVATLSSHPSLSHSLSLSVFSTIFSSSSCCRDLYLYLHSFPLSL